MMEETEQTELNETSEMTPIKFVTKTPKNKLPEELELLQERLNKKVHGKVKLT